MQESAQRTDVVLAAGAVVWRSRDNQQRPSGQQLEDRHPGNARTREQEPGSEPEVVLIHRARHADWTLPKGKLDPGEACPVTAVREVAEETGLVVQLGVPMSDVRYALLSGQTKRVSYWTAEPTSGDTAAYVANDEIERVEWLPLREARERLTYDRDRVVLDEFEALHDKGATRARPLVVLRHAAAKPRTKWRGDDRRRTLTEEGLAQAEGLVRMLAAWGVRRVVTSDSARCVQTVLPFADSHGVDVVLQRRLTQEDADRAQVRSITRRLFASHRRVVVCTHRPVLPWVFDALGLDDPRLDPGELVVVHRLDGDIVTTERH